MAVAIKLWAARVRKHAQIGISPIEAVLSFSDSGFYGGGIQLNLSMLESVNPGLPGFPGLAASLIPGKSAGYYFNREVSIADFSNITRRLSTTIDQKPRSVKVFRNELATAASAVYSASR